MVQNNIVNAALKPGHQPLKALLVMRLVHRAGAWPRGHHGAVCGPWRAAPSYDAVAYFSRLELRF